MLNKVFKPINKLLIKNTKNFCSKSTTFNESDKKILESFKITMNTLKENEKKDTFKAKLSPEQQGKVEILVDKYISMNEFQIQLYSIMKQEILAAKKLTRMQINTDWFKIMELENKIPNINQTYFQQQEFMANFTSWLSKQPKPDLGLGSATVAAPVQKAEVKKEAPKVEEKKEKAAYDIELTSFDAAKKISIIKEVRSYTNLGLKEAKELVEKAPVIILKGVKKEDSEAITKKLSDCGAKITLK